MLASELAPWNAEGIVALLHMQCTNTAYAEHPSLKLVQASHLMKLSLSTWLMVEEVTYNYNKCCGSKLVWSYLS